MTFPSGTPTDLEPPRTRFLDGLRGLAALYVLIHHALRISWARPADVVQPINWTRLHALLMRAFDHGYPAVIFFFVLSGFVIHLRQAHDVTGTFHSGWFFARRLRRLLPPLLGAIALTWLADGLAARLGYRWFYAGAGEAFTVFGEGIQANHGWRTLIGNVAFVAQIHVPMWGTNGALWSLSYEWWFYVLYPTLLFLNRRSVAWSTLAVVAGFAVVTLVWPSPPIQGGVEPFEGIGRFALPLRVFAALPAWYAGMLLADAYVGRTRCLTLRAYACLTPLLFIGALAKWPDGPRTALIGLGFSGALACAFLWQRAGRSLRLLDRLGTLGDFSYTLYVIHLPLVILLWPAWALHAPPMLAPVGVLLLIAIPLAVAYLLHFVLEKPFMTTARSAGASVSGHASAGAAIPAAT